MIELKMSEFIGLLRKNEIVRKVVPMEMASGLPIIIVRKTQIYVTVPYYMQKLRPKDQTLIYPLACSVTALWPSGKVVDFRNFAFSKEFERIDFSKPIGTFRHEAVSDLSKQEYYRYKQDLLDCYDELIRCRKADVPFDNKEHMKALADMIIEPYQKPMYRILDKAFYDDCLSLVCV